MPPVSDRDHPSDSAHVPLSAIAREAGVATSTVSRALRSDARIGTKTRQHVQAVAQRLGHRSHPLVSALMAQVRNRRPPVARWNLAWLDFRDTSQDWRTNHVSAAFHNGVRARAEAAGYAFERVWVRDPRLRNHPAGLSARLTEILLARGVRGLLLQGFREGADGTATAIPVDLGKFAIAGVGTAFHSPALHFASNDQHLSTQLAVRELRSLGHRRIGYVGEPLTETVVSHRFVAGYLATMRQTFGLRPLPPLVTLADDVLIDWVKTHRPTVIISTEPHIPRVLRAHGYSVPHDIGFAHLHVAEDDAVTTGICQQSEAVAAAATDLLIGALSNNETGVPAHPRGVLIPGRWRRGRTVRNLRA
ncbi:MAG: LacI family transcriptional regulator [Opitutaceae bacterium]|jgi:DNA-binding LacI/PurR family transcriptional regulator|nr:LacI family transcriptional regulator [Opitutaceae bacterium]